MDEDPFQELLGLEDEFYREGYDAGVADSTYTGMIEGKVFGIEKGYEKALELAKLRGRAMVWKARFSKNQKAAEGSSSCPPGSLSSEDLSICQVLKQIQSELDGLPVSSRLQKHIENLLAITDDSAVITDNSDEAVTAFDDRLAKARAKAKIIANIVGEPLNPATTINSGIEDATGLNARH